MHKNYPDSFKEDRHIEDAVEKMLYTPEYPYAVDDKRLAEFRHAWDLLTECLDVKPDEITGKCEAPQLDIGSISIKCKNLKVKDVSKFLEALKLASCVELFAQTNGVFAFDLTFWGIVHYTKDKEDEDE